MDRTESKIGTPMTHGDSRPVRFRLLGPDGTPVGWTFETAKEAGEYAAMRWPHLKQDEDRTGKGWDVEVA